MANFKPNESVEEILEKMNRNGGNIEMIHAGSAFLQYKLQEKLLEDQQKKHEEQLGNQSINDKELLDTQAEQHKQLLDQQKRHNSIQFILTGVIALTAIASAVFSGLTYKNISDASQVTNRPYVYIEETDIEEYTESESKMYRVILRVKNAGNLAALHSNMRVFLGKDEITSSRVFSEGHVISANSDNETWIILNENSVKSIIRDSENQAQMTVEFTYKDALKEKHCIKSLHSIVVVDDTYKLASDGSYECEDEN